MMEITMFPCSRATGQSKQRRKALNKLNFLHRAKKHNRETRNLQDTREGETFMKKNGLKSCSNKIKFQPEDPLLLVRAS